MYELCAIWQREFEHDFFLGEGGECWICGEQTNFLNISFEGYMCSGLCLHQGWSDYYTANKLTDEKYGNGGQTNGEPF